MASKRIKTLLIELNSSRQNLVAKIIGKKAVHDFSDIELLRKLLSNEKARILLTIKNKKPRSIYTLAKLLKRDFKSVRQDIILLERFGLLEFHLEKKGKRESLMPVLKVDRINLVIDI